MRIVGILLAAGSGTRFGGDKLLTPLPGVSFGTPLGVAAATHLLTALPDSLAVVRPGDDRLIDALRRSGLRIVVCASAADGMGTSLGCGVAAATHADGWVVALADMPWIAPATIHRIADALAAGADIVVPAFRGERGHPVGFAKRHRAALAALTGDAGARSVVAAHPEAVTLIDVDDAGTLRDVDTPAALM